MSAHFALGTIGGARTLEQTRAEPPLVLSVTVGNGVDVVQPKPRAKTVSTPPPRRSQSDVAFKACCDAQPMTTRAVVDVVLSTRGMQRPLGASHSVAASQSLALTGHNDAGSSLSLVQQHRRELEVVTAAHVAALVLPDPDGL